MADPPRWESRIASIAQCINSAEVPCVLWGHSLLNLHGVPSILGSIDFVVPDESLAISSEYLSQLPFLESCADQNCICSSPTRSTPGPASHYHLKGSEVTVGLYLQSETLWFLPPLDKKLSCPSRDTLSEHFVLASDKTVLPSWRPGRGPGVLQPAQGDLIVAPKSHVLLEAFIRMYARDEGTRAGAFGIAMLAYMEEYVEDDGYLDIEKLPIVLRRHYLELKEGQKPVRQWTRELKESLGIPYVEPDDD
ncbi:hypothetical protein F5Y04DRAFT_148847 [Hypomontagnella monticulosa]|nr:hypothetical protein F5Y04DRAFT_148847 [Hypomontagnella monticulosa]